MRRISKEEVNVVGDTLEACLYSRFLLSTNENITKIDHYATDNIGGIYCDKEKGNHYNILFLNCKTKDKILEILPNYEFEMIVDNYIKIPSKKIPFNNSYDGYIRFPITRKSFEVDLDYSDCILSVMSFEQFVKEFKEIKNMTKMMKLLFSDSFYMNIIKKIGGNQWNINTTQIDPIRLYRSVLGLDYINNDDIVEYYHPVGGATKLCEDLLNHPKINVIRSDRKSIKKVVSTEQNKITYIQDYIDYYMNFMFGSIDYIQYQTEIHKKSISHIDTCRVYTPYDKKYFQFFEKDSIIYKSYSEPRKISSNEFEYLSVIPSFSNHKKINEYKKVAAVSQTIKIIG